MSVCHFVSLDVFVITIIVIAIILIVIIVIITIIVVDIMLFSQGRIFFPSLCRFASSCRTAAAASQVVIFLHIFLNRVDQLLKPA